MFEINTFPKGLLWLAAIAAVLFAASPSAAAEGTAKPVVQSVESDAPADACGPPQLFERGWLPGLSAQGAVGEEMILARPPFLRTCRCSCGFPCTTDADCGPGGKCTAGITCCAAPEEGEGDAAPADPLDPPQLSEPGLLPALSTQGAGEEMMLARPPFLRTCACSCGLPCTTDADCGFGGICIGGITCCAAPDVGEGDAPSAPGVQGAAS